MVSSLHSDHYQFDDFLYSPTEGVVIRGEKRIILKARENQLLHILIKYHPEPASRDVLQTALWSRSYATSSTLCQAVKTLRDELQDEERILIRTIPKTGYILGASPTLIPFQNSESKRQLPLKSAQITSWLCGFFIASLALLLGYQLAKPDLPNAAVIEANVHYLFEPNSTERARFALVHPEAERVFVLHKPKGYQVCHEQKGVMRCAIVP